MDVTQNANSVEKKCYVDNQDRLLNKQIFYIEENRDQIIEYRKKYNKQNRAKMNIYEKKTDLNLKLACIIQSRTSSTFESQNVRKTKKTFV